MNRLILIIAIVSALLIFGLPFYFQHNGAILEKNIEIFNNNHSIENTVKYPEDEYDINNITEDDIRQPAVAGEFYPADADELSSVIDDYLKQADVKNYPGVPQLIISPHAGYIYSGRVTAYSFKQIKGADFKRIILIGRSHRKFFPKVAADGRKVWATPLGNILVDQDLIKVLRQKSSNITN